MCSLFSPNQRLEIDDLKAQMKKDRHVIWGPCQPMPWKQMPWVCAQELANLLRGKCDFDCNRLVLQNMCIVGPLNLTGAGKLGTPVIPVELKGCLLQGGIDTSHAYLQGIVIHDCCLEKIEDEDKQRDPIKSCPGGVIASTIVGKPGESAWLRFTGAEISEKVEIHNLISPEDTILDFSHATIKHSCELRNIGRSPKQKDWKSTEKEDVISCITFVSANITGGLTLEGVRVTAKTSINPSMDGRALNCTELTLKGGLNLRSNEDRQCYLSGEFTLTGAVLEGQMVLQGVTMKALDSVTTQGNQSLKAISANGVTINGGIVISEDEENAPPQRIPTRILGDFRLRNAKIAGRVKFQGVEMESSNQKIAFDASGTTFSSDLIFRPAEQANRPMKVVGEINLSGATVLGNFTVAGVDFTCRDTGTAIEATLLSVSKSVYIGEANEFEAKRQATLIKGIVNLNFLSCALLTIGDNPPSGRAKDTESAEPSLKLIGVILLHEARIRGPVVISEVELKPSEKLPDYSKDHPTWKRLKQLSVYRDNVLISANSAELGTRLFVRLKRYTCYGFISLYGAKTGTIGALHSGKSSDESPAFVDECWGEIPRQQGKEDSSCLQWRAGNPVPGNEDNHFITLNLDEFRYSRLSDKKDETRDKEKKNWFIKTWWLLIGRPSTEDVLPRHGWLRHQIRNPGLTNDLVIWPYRQLAKVYRDMGDLKHAYVYETERRWLQIRRGEGILLQRIIDALFGVLFGFGYSSARAMFCLCLWFLLFSGFLYWAASHACGPNPCWWPETPRWDRLYHAGSEAIKLLVPDALKLRTELPLKFESDWKETEAGQAIFRFFLGAFQILGRIIVIGATLTFTGVLQEKAPVATYVRE